MLAACLALIDEPTDREKFENLYYTYKDMMFKLAMSILHNDALAQETVQDCFFKIAKIIGEISSVESNKTKALIVIMTKNKARYNLRAEHSEKTDTINDTQISEKVFNDIMSELGFEKLSKLIDGLDPTYRDVMVLRIIDGYSVNEISEICDIPYRTVETRLLRGRKILKEKMEEEYDKFSI